MSAQNIIEQLKKKYGPEQITEQTTSDGVTTVWIKKENIQDCMNFLKTAFEST